MSDRSDRKELMILADVYLDVTRCVKGHVIMRGLVCLHCDSGCPSEECNHKGPRVIHE